MLNEIFSFSCPESIFCNIALRSLCLTWSDLRTPRDSVHIVRTSRSLRNTRASSWTSNLWRKMMNAELGRITVCQTYASKISNKYIFSCKNSALQILVILSRFVLLLQNTSYETTASSFVNSVCVRAFLVFISKSKAPGHQCNTNFDCAFNNVKPKN